MKNSRTLRDENFLYLIENYDEENDLKTIYVVSVFYDMDEANKMFDNIKEINEQENDFSM